MRRLSQGPAVVHAIHWVAMKIVILVLLLAVVASLFSGLYFVYKDKGSTNRAVISLTIRIALSILVFLLLLGSYWFGWIPGARL